MPRSNAAIFKFRLHGKKLRGEFALVKMRNRGKGNEWLIIKKKDAEAKPGWNIEDHANSVLTGRTQQQIAENLPRLTNHQPPATSRQPLIPGAIQSPFPRTIAPMLATLTNHPPSGDQWLYEVKWDGVRAIVFVEDNQLRILSRTGKRCDQQYPELTVLPHFLKASSAILDGEIAVLDDNGRSSFNLIQPRISVTDPNSIAHLARSNPVTLFLFDLLYLDGYDLRGVALEKRKQLLEEILTPSDHIRFSDHFRREWRRDARSRARPWSRRNPRQTPHQQIRRAPHAGLVQNQSRDPPGIRDRRIHARRARLFQLAGARASTITASWCTQGRWEPASTTNR